MQSAGGCCLPSSVGEYDLSFYFDPVCPFAWMSSKWVRLVMEQRAYSVDWRFISLRLVNATVDYSAQFPPEYEAGHTAGLKLLRVAAKAREVHGPEAVGPLYLEMGRHIFESSGAGGGWAAGAGRASEDAVRRLLAEVGLSPELADALEDASIDPLLSAETDEALALTGKDVGTPIIHVQPPEGVAFFGPVISRLPSSDDAVRLWDHVVGLASFPGFAELKRSLREQPQLPAFGVAPDAVGTQEDWHGGSRRLKK